MTEPRRGWKGYSALDLRYANPRVPALPATLNIRLDEYFAAATLMGLLASQIEEPNQKWACEWSFRMGTKMAAEAKRRRTKS